MKKYDMIRERSLVLVLIWLIIAFPIAYAQLIEIPPDQIEKIEEDILNIPYEGGVEGMIGEDIIIDVDFYQPRVIPTDIIEDRGIVVNALLSGRTTNPTITIPRIKNIFVKKTQVTTIPEGRVNNVRGIQYHPPLQQEFSYDNLGYISIPLGRIPREEDVPDEIQIDVDARIYFDVSSGLLAGPTRDILQEQTFDAWSLERDQHQFYAGYIYAPDIQSNQATFRIFDKEMNELSHPVTISVGQQSPSIRASRTGSAFYGRVFDKFRISLKEIRGLSEKATFLVTKDDKTEFVTASKGEPLYYGSAWLVEDIHVSEDGTIAEATLRNHRTRSAILLNTTNHLSERSVNAEKVSIEESVQAEELARYGTEFAELNDLVKNKNHEQFLTKASALLNNQLSDLEKQEFITILLQERTELMSSLTKQQSSPNPSTDATGLLLTQLEKLRELLSRLNASSPAAINSQLSTMAYDDAFRLAIQNYQQILNLYPAEVDPEKNYPYSADALNRLARIYWLELNNPYQAGAIYLQLKNQYPEIALTIEPNIDRFIQLFTNSAFSSQSANARLSDENAIVSLLSASTIPINAQPSVNLVINGQERTYNLYDTISTGVWSWRVAKIKDNQIILEHQEPSGIIQAALNQGINQLPTSDKTSIEVRVTKISLKREAVIVVEPNTESAFTDSSFALHLYIEKKPFDLPLFSASLDEEIERTEELLGKLDGIIDSATELLTYWKGFCLATFGVLTLKNMVAGGTTNVARKKVNEEFRRRYSDPNEQDLKCQGITFEQCIFQNQALYESKIEEAESILGEIDQGKHLKEFDSLKEDFEEDLKDLYFAKRKFELDPENTHLTENYLSLHSQMTQRQLNKKLTETFISGKDFKPYSDPTVRPIVDDILSRYPRVKESGKTNDQIYKLHKEEIIDIYRNEQLNSGLKSYYGDLQNKYTSQTAASVIQKLSDRSLSIKTESVTIPSYSLHQKDGKTYGWLGQREIEIPQLKPGENVFEKEGITFTISTGAAAVAHKALVTLMKEGKAKDQPEDMTVDAYKYLEAEYSESGRLENVYVYRRSDPNGEIGSGNRIGELNDEIRRLRERGDLVEAEKLEKAKSCFDQIRKRTQSQQFKRGDTNIATCADLGSYSIGTSSQEIGPSCTDVMSPSDCKLLFNACDPVICPATRCNFGGEWNVDNVVETGVIGSSLLCIRNFPQVVFPVCLTGIVAGMQNIRSIVQGYKQCLITAQVEGRSVGICDRIRNFGVCEMLWKEGIAIFNVKEGLLGLIGKKVFGIEDAGSEYSSFTQSFKTAEESLQYFTQSYAKNTFALYSGGSLPEIGAAICKQAIFGKIPGIGNFFDQVLRPESPPQFTAFFDEVPISDIPRPLSSYRVFFHVYAGENQPITYSVYLDTPGLGTERYAMPPFFVKRNVRLPAGGIASEDLATQELPAGYQRICVVINSDLYGVKEDCGFSKVSTSYFANLLSQGFTQSELLKQIDTEEECRPSASRLTTISSQDIGGSSLIGQVPRAAVGSFSTGLLQTGIIRKCSEFDPDVGTANTGENDAWVPVGTCGKDERGRELGTCWLHRPSALGLIDQSKAQKETADSLDEKVKTIIQEAKSKGDPIPEQQAYTDEELENIFLQAAQLRKSNPDESAEDLMRKLVEATNLYDKILAGLFVKDEISAKTLYEKARTYEEIGRALKERAVTVSIQQVPPGPAPTSPTPPSSTPPAAPSSPQQCIIKEAYWSSDEDGLNKVNNVLENTKLVYAVVLADDCNDKEVKLNLAPKNNPGIPIAGSNVRFKNNKAIGRFLINSLAGQYILKITIDGKSQDMTNELTIYS